MKPKKLQKNMPHPLEGSLAEHARTAELGVEATMAVKSSIDESGEKVSQAVKELKPEMKRVSNAAEFIEGFLTSIKGDKGDPGPEGKEGKGADEAKIAADVAQQVIESFPKTEEIVDEVMEGVKPLIPTRDDIVATVLPLINDGADGKDGAPGKDSDPAQVAKLIKSDPEFIKKTKGDKGEKGDAGSPDTGEQIVAKIKQVIKYSDIKDAPEFKSKGSISHVRELNDVDTTGLIVGQVLQWNGTKWVPYTPISAVNSLIIQKTSGTIDDTNLEFIFGTATAQPTALQINGVMYLPSAGAITWTWDAGTKKATLSSAVGINGSIFGIV